MSGRRQNAESRGRWAEVAAQLLLTLKGYRILATRVRTPRGEIDLVVLKGRTVVFVEVKARRSFDVAIEAITHQQQSRIIAASQVYLARRPALCGYDVRFDAVVLVPRRWPQHIVDAWRPR